MAPSKSEQKKLLKFNLTSHKPTEDAVKKIEEFRRRAINLGNWLVDNTTYTREQSLALTSLEEFAMKSVASIARYETEDKR